MSQLLIWVRVRVGNLVSSIVSSVLRKVHKVIVFEIISLVPSIFRGTVATQANRGQC